MSRPKIEGVCCICGANGRLTFEHIPPEAAFNNKAILEADIDSLIAAQNVQERRNPRTSKKQRGAGRYSLCNSCNSNTGSWYVPSYLRWAQQGWNNLYGAPGTLVHRPFEIEPLPVAKQILAMFASACGPSFFGGRPELVRFVLNRFETGLPPDVRLYAYYVHPSSQAARQSGITSAMNYERSPLVYVHSEIAFLPFGYVMCLGSKQPDSRLVDITFMADASMGEKRTLSLRLHPLMVDSFIPCDYRSNQEIEAAF